MIEELILIFTICTVIGYFWSQKRRDGLPPGPIRLPVLGSAIQLYLADPVYPHLALAKLSEKFGNVMSFGFGMHTAVIISSFEDLQEVFNRAEILNRFEFPYITDRNFGQNLGIIWGRGDQWNDVRQFTKKTLKKFGYGKLEKTDESLNDSANVLVDCIKTDLMDSPGRIFSVSEQKFSVHVLNIVWNMVGGYKFDATDKNLQRNMECVDKLEYIFGHSNPYNLFPFLKTWFPKQMRYPEHVRIFQEIHEFTESLINDVKARRSERFDSEATSFIEVFLDKIECSQGDSETMFTHEQLVIILEDLFFGGLVTNGTFLSWSIYFFVKYPDVQEKFRQEILNNMKNRIDFLRVIELKAIPYVKATITEIIRMGNVAPIPFPRTTTADMTIRDYLIPKGTALFYNLHVMYNDKSFWKDPAQFRPDRFLTEDGEVDKMRSERVLNTVFGVGPRICFGEALAIDSLYMFLATMVVNFQFDKVPGEELSLGAPRSQIVLSPPKFSVTITTREVAK